MLKIIGTSLAVIILATIFGLASAYYRAVNLRGVGTAEKELIVKAGDGPSAIAKKLKEQGFLTSPKVFLVHALLTGKRSKFYPGTYRLTGNDSIVTLVRKLTDPIARRISLTIPEGWRINDIATEVEKKTEISKEEFLAHAKVSEYEGFLFPDTYFFPPEVKVETIVKTLRDNFDTRTKDLGLTKEEVTLASIVEREAKTDSDRAAIAGVYLNRLAIDMALEADPTVQYAKGSWEPITLADYRAVISPYNTYLNRGLPPTPIANPGLAALKAVKAPAEHEYYYFFHTPDGKTIYSKTVDEHNRNKQKYLR